jgi:hypothetical protein
MPAQSETFLLKFSYTTTDSETGITSTVNEEGVGISYPVTATGFDDVLIAASDPVRGDGYYGRADGFHTIQTNLSDFVGIIKVQGTLDVDPTESDWFTVQLGTGNRSVDTTGLIREENITQVQYIEEKTGTNSYNFTGNYVKIRIKIENWTAGTVNSIYLNH